MDVRAILQTINRMFPGSKLNEAVEQARRQIQGTADSLQGASATARNLGISRGIVDEIYNQYGRSYQARMICKLLGTTPEALKADAERIAGGHAEPAPQSPAASRKFPRLK